MKIRHLFGLSLIALAGACSTDGSSSTGANNGACEGKCDAFEPPALTATAGDFGLCTLTPDTEAADEFFAADVLSCQFVGFDESIPVTFDRAYVTAKLAGDRFTNSAQWGSEEFDGREKVALRVRTDAYPMEVDLQPIAKYPTNDSGRLNDSSEPTRRFSSALPRIKFTIDSRPTEPKTFPVALPMEFWPVVVWPTQELADQWDAEALDYLSFRISNEVVIGERAQGTYFGRLAARDDKLDALPETRFVIPTQPGQPLPSIEVRLDTSADAIVGTLDGPGYYLLEANGAITKATPAEVEARGMFDRDTTPGADVADPPAPEPDTEPEVPEPTDPCSGACDATEACVAGACVALADQRQTNCNSTATAACDGEDTDCAEGNVCVEGVCKLRSCHTQSTLCDPARFSCEQDTDCAADHACSGGLCVRLSCQTQSTFCDPPRRTCEESTDCAAEHACVDGECRRLTCQTQSSFCDPARNPCGLDSDCAAEHACAGGLCVRISCQTQSNFCDPARRTCDAGEDSDCAADHTCNAEGLCERLSCVR